MSKEELIKGLKYLGTVYGKEYTSLECEIHYDFLKDYEYKVFIQAVKKIIRTSKFLPKITDLVDECENSGEEFKVAILEYMRVQGYFKNADEYEKAVNFIKRDNIPSWFKNDMDEYMNIMNRTAIGTSGRPQLEYSE